jgi:hypothetical protein
MVRNRNSVPRVQSLELPFTCVTCVRLGHALVRCLTTLPLHQQLLLQKLRVAQLLFVFLQHNLNFVFVFEDRKLFCSGVRIDSAQKKCLDLLKQVGTRRVKLFGTGRQKRDMFRECGNRNSTELDVLGQPAACSSAARLAVRNEGNLVERHARIPSKCLLSKRNKANFHCSTNAGVERSSALLGGGDGGTRCTRGRGQEEPQYRGYNSHVLCYTQVVDVTNRVVDISLLESDIFVNLFLFIYFVFAGTFLSRCQNVVL